MKKILSTLLAFVMLATTILAVPFSAQAEVKYPEASGTLKNGQTFTYDASTETLTISGEGVITDYGYSGSGASPFADCTIKHIVIGEGITEMGKYIFNEVVGIDTVSLPASLTSIIYRCFEKCEFIGSGFTVADGSERYCAVGGNLYNKDKTSLVIFANSGITDFTVPDTVSRIESDAFNRNVTLDRLVLNGTDLYLQNYAIDGAKIKHLEINEGVKNLGDYSSIDSAVWRDETITLPASLETIGTQSIFDDATPIKNFVVAEGNTVFSTIDGVLYKDGTTLFKYPAGRTDTSYTVPDGTTTIGNCAFSSCNNLESVDFPANVKKFSGRCLCYCSKLTTVNIRALDAEFLATDCFFGMNSSVVYNVYENSVTHKNLLDYGIEESKIKFFPSCAEHSYQFTKTVEPTCYAKGYDLYTCSVCGTTEKRNETNMVDHEAVTTYNEDKTIEHHKCKNFSFVIEETENLPESEHNYQSNTDTYFELSYPGADTISITFDDQFKTETKYDYLMVYDRDGNEIAKYTGTEPADQTYTLNGDYIKLNFHSDGSNEYYGFKITKVVAEKVGCDYAEPDTPHTHSYGDYVSDGNATCTENGTETATCACGETTNRTEENSALGHDFVVTKIRPATCGADGYTDYECTVCSATKHEDITERPNHKLSDKYDSETNSVITSCANKDSFVVEFTENLPESKHNYENNTSEEYVLEYPGADTISITFDDQFYTETKYDYLIAYDRNGNEIAKYQGTEPAGQTYTLNGDYIKLNFQSDSSKNYYGFKITKVDATYPGCGYETSAPHTTHDVPTGTSNNDATCTEDGTKTGTCTICDKSVTVTDEGSKLGHSFTNYVSNNNATCTSNATETATCDRADCDDTDTREIADSALGHSYVPTVVPASCTTQGYTTYTCSVCGDSNNADFTDALGHSFGANNQACSVCGATNPNYVAPTPTPTPTPTPAPAPAPSNVIIFNGESIKPNSSGEYVSKKAKKPTISKLVKGKKSFKITWKKVSGVSGYQVQYSTSSKFTKKTSKKVTYKGNKKFTKTVSKLKGGKKYYVRVRTYKTVNGKKVYSGWSKVKTVTTKK